MRRASRELEQRIRKLGAFERITASLMHQKDAARHISSIGMERAINFQSAEPLTI
jgi:hypothetical protein